VTKETLRLEAELVVRSATVSVVRFDDGWGVCVRDADKEWSPCLVYIEARTKNAAMVGAFHAIRAMPLRRFR
jgi:hypothetical protein